MDKAVNSALQFDMILGLIKPVGESGKYFMHHLPMWKAGEEHLLKKEYLRLQVLINHLSHNRTTIEQFRSALAEIPRLPQTLKALQERSLLLHECFELKKLLFYANQIRILCLAHQLDKIYPFPDLTKPYSLLDPQAQNCPTFSLSAAFDNKLAGFLAALQDLNLQKRQAEHLVMQSAKQALQLSQTTDTIVVSRSQINKIRQLEKSPFYQLSDENFANLTFKLKPTKQIILIRKKIAVLSTRLSQREEIVLQKLSLKLRAYHKTLLRTAELVCMLDWDYAKAMFAMQYNCIIPQISTKMQLKIIDAVNLPVQLNLVEGKYQPVNLHFSARINVITGPNMGGKTTALKTAGQLCLLSKHAIPIPAKEAELCLFDNLWYNHDNTMEQNLSSFGREIVSLSNILSGKGRNLLLLDELAKGTNPAEGETILIAVLEYINKLPCLCLAATHFDKPALLRSAAQYTIKGVDTAALSSFFKPEGSNLKEQLLMINSMMDYSLLRLSKQEKPPQNAIPIAHALGLPEEIITRAQELMS